MGKKHKKHKSERHSTEETEKTPIKLILKLGSEGTYDSDYAANSPSYSHKKKKKKHSSETSTVKIVEPPPVEKTTAVDDCDDMQVDEASKIAEDLVEHAELPAVKPAEPPVLKIVLSQNQRKALNVVLNHLLIQLERKDPNNIFQWPVTDTIAPGYSSMIKHPMDFSTMRNKITTNLYFAVLEMKKDFEQMIENCCIYNNEDTVFYQLAKKLLTAGSKIFSKERLVSMLKSLSATGVLPEDEIEGIIGLCGVERMSVTITRIDEAVEHGVVSVEAPDMDATSNVADKALEYETVSFTDQDEALSVAPNAAEVAKEARDKLKAKGNVGKLGFLNMDEDGKCTMRILNPDHGLQEMRPVDLGVLTGPLQSGIDTMTEVKEDKRNKVTPLEYLSYGPFGSFAPTYDSRIANLTQEESDMLLSAYSGETGYLFAQSIQEFVSDCSGTFVNMVQDMLDNVTHGAHSRTTNEILQKRKLSSAKDEKTTESKVPNVDFDQLRTLKDLDIDVSFVDAAEEEVSKQATTHANSVTARLDRSGALLQKLKNEQIKRLSTKPDNKGPNLAGPTDEERAVASELQQTFVSLASNAAPGKLVSDATLHKAMRVDL